MSTKYKKLEKISMLAILSSPESFQKKNEMNKDIIEFEKYLLQVDLEWVEQREIEWESGF